MDLQFEELTREGHMPKPPFLSVMSAGSFSPYRESARPLERLI
jgi:hypothetical protein